MKMTSSTKDPVAEAKRRRLNSAQQIVNALKDDKGTGEDAIYFLAKQLANRMDLCQTLIARIEAQQKTIEELKHARAI